MELSDSLMIARGDLGVELGHERVPIAQTLLTNAASKKGLSPIICATMMMESMIGSPVPTRAEVSDCFNAVLDGSMQSCFQVKAPRENTRVRRLRCKLKSSKKRNTGAKATICPVDSFHLLP